MTNQKTIQFVRIAYQKNIRGVTATQMSKNVLALLVIITPYQITVPRSNEPTTNTTTIDETHNILADQKIVPAAANQPTVPANLRRSTPLLRKDQQQLALIVINALKKEATKAI